MATFNHIGGAEPSTLTFKIRTIQITQNSSNMQQEILSLGDPNSSAAIAECSSGVPSSTQVGLVTKEAGGFLSSLGGRVLVDQNSTAWQVQIHGDSTVVQGTSPWVVGFQAGNLSSAAQSGNSSGLIVRPVWSSSNADQPVQTSFLAGYISSAAQSGNSSGLTVRPVWSSSNADQPVQAVFPAGYLSTAAQSGNSSGLTVRPVWSSSNADQPVSAAQSGNWNIVTVTTVTSLSSLSTGHVTVDTGSIAVATFAAGLMSSAVLAANSSALSVRNVWSSTNTDQPVSAALALGTLQSSAAPSSNSSGLIVRQVVDNLLVTVSTNALASTSLSVQSSGAGLRSYVTAYSITSTLQTPTSYKFYSAATLVWSVRLAALSSAVAGANLAVAPPGYLFRTNAADPLTFQSASTITNVNVSVSYFRAP